MKLYEGKIYSIVSKETEMIYIGSTTLTLELRFAIHKNDMKRGKNCSSIEMLKYPDCGMYLIDRLYVTKSNRDPELLKLEGKYQLINKDICVNKQVSRGLTQKEHNIRRYTDPETREKSLKQCKKYNEARKEYAKQYDHFRKYSFFGQLCKLYKIYI